MEFFKKKYNVNFLGLKNITGPISIALIVMSIGLMLFRGINLGMEFTGGVQIELQFNQSIQLKEVEDLLVKSELKLFKLQYLDSDKVITAKFHLSKDNIKLEQDLALNMEKLFADYKVKVNKIEFIGSEVGDNLAEQGIIAVIIAILSTMVYIALRFEYRLAISAALGLTHDALIIIGIFSLFQIEFDLSVLASILAVIGYSLNDTIVVFDRIRENFKVVRTGNTVEIINLSINQTLSRTIMTSLMTLLVVLALLFLGGESLFGFSLALAIGIIVGTYSSIYVAGVIAVMLGLSRNDMLPKLKTEYDNLP